MRLGPLSFMVNNFEHQTEYDITIAHMQIDNVVARDTQMIILSPEQNFDKHSFLTAQDFIPFIQLKLSLTSRDINGSIDTKVEALQFQIQAIYLEIETGTLKTIINNFIKIMKVFDAEREAKVNNAPTKVPISTSLKLSPGKKTLSQVVNEGKPAYASLPIEEV
mmetsp:Transcript_15683/g.15478  ORF Transcript_15683/g.15478 Transcript_15683/m.15478 type:complete len:164 (+) Transcript_15683:290-781(+)